MSRTPPPPPTTPPGGEVAKTRIGRSRDSRTRENERCDESGAVGTPNGEMRLDTVILEEEEEEREKHRCIRNTTTTRTNGGDTPCTAADNTVAVFCYSGV